MSKATGGGATTSQASQTGRTRGSSFSTSGGGGGGGESASTQERLATYKESLKAIRELPKVTFTKSSQHKEAKEALGLSNVSDQEFAAMFGALNGSTISVFPPRYETGQWFVTINNKFLSSPQRRVIEFDEDSGELFITNSELRIKSDYQKNKLGALILGKQVYFARKNKVSYLETYAAKGETSNGSYTWAVLGYDRMLTPSERSSAKSYFNDTSKKSPKTVQDVLDMPNGKAYWLANHKAGDMMFDLQRGSVNSNALRKYIRNNIKVKNLEFMRSFGK